MSMTTGSGAYGSTASSGELDEVVNALTGRYPEADADEVERLVRRVHAAVLADPRVGSAPIDLTRSRVDEYLYQWWTRHYGTVAAEEPSEEPSEERGDERGDRSRRALLIVIALGTLLAAGLVATALLFGGG